MEMRTSGPRGWERESWGPLVPSRHSASAPRAAAQVATGTLSVWEGEVWEAPRDTAPSLFALG